MGMVAFFFWFFFLRGEERREYEAVKIKARLDENSDLTPL